MRIGWVFMFMVYNIDFLLKMGKKHQSGVLVINPFTPSAVSVIRLGRAVVRGKVQITKRQPVSFIITGFKKNENEINSKKYCNQKKAFLHYMRLQLVSSVEARWHHNAAPPIHNSMYLTRQPTVSLPSSINKKLQRDKRRPGKLIRGSHCESQIRVRSLISAASFGTAIILPLFFCTPLFLPSHFKAEAVVVVVVVGLNLLHVTHLGERKKRGVNCITPKC